MRLRTSALTFVLLALAICSLNGGSRNPAVRKQKYLESGVRYYEKGKYREAVIQFSNALQVDPKFAAAHFRLAQADMKLGALSSAYAELQRTVDLDPKNVEAHLDLGNLLLLGRGLDKAAEQGKIVLELEPNNPSGLALQANIDAI